MLTSIRIRNFKCFQDTGNLAIRPLTFLVGPNSSGKSSILQMLLMLRQTIDSSDAEIPLAANDSWVQMGAYPDFIYKGEYNKRPLQIELGYHLRPHLFPSKAASAELVSMNLKAVFGYNPKTTQIRLKEREITIPNQLRERIEIGESRKKYSFSLAIKKGGKWRKWKPREVVPVNFHGCRFLLKADEKPDEFFASLPWGEAYLPTWQVVEREFANLFYLGPLRESPKRFYPISGQAPQHVGTKGELAADTLWFCHRSRSKRVKSTEAKVRRWFRDFNIAKDLKLVRIAKGNYYQIIAVDPATGAKVSLADIGFGASQVLPVILESFYSKAESLLLIEQPEIHLHPKAQSTLGDVFIEAAKETKRTFIIETHSEHLLARIRRRIAEGKINRKEVVIYYFTPSPSGTRIQRIAIDQDGQYSPFPRGFFDEDVVEAYEHLKAVVLYNKNVD